MLLHTPTGLVIEKWGPEGFLRKTKDSPGKSRAQIQGNALLAPGGQGRKQ